MVEVGLAGGVFVLSLLGCLSLRQKCGCGSTEENPDEWVPDLLKGILFYKEMRENNKLVSIRC